ncbi:MAG: hypothetical protein EP329_24455 [Deltaproteobacteria bacterium]|nr:MAG: hypothetical protein EP329_24455 [Deltaproteobacteria bacterium]
MNDPTDIDDRELQRRVLYAIVRPLVRLADAFRVPLSDVVNLVQVAYFHHLRDKGLKLAEIGERLDVSERSAKRLAKQLRETFVDAERRYDLPVKIEFMIWATPMSRTKVNQLLGAEEPAAVEQAIDQLIAEGRLIEEEGRTPRLMVNQRVNTLVRDTWLTRIGGLNSFLGNLGDAVFGRFFRAEPRAMARTLNFLIRPGDRAVLERFFMETLVPVVQQVDEDAQGAEDAERFRMSLCWAPYHYVEDEIAAATGDEGDES